MTGTNYALRPASRPSAHRQYELFIRVVERPSMRNGEIWQALERLGDREGLDAVHRLAANAGEVASEVARLRSEIATLASADSQSRAAEVRLHAQQLDALAGLLRQSADRFTVEAVSEVEQLLLSRHSRLP